MKKKINKFKKEDAENLYIKWGLEPISWGHYFFPHYFSMKSPPFHYEIADNFYSIPKEVQAYEAARGFGKTTLGEFLCFHAAVFRGYMFIMYISLTESIASDRIVDIRNECDSNDNFRAFFGELKTGKWGEKDILLQNDKRKIRCRILARGLGQQILGIKYLFQRPQLIIIDDPEDIGIAENPDNVDKDERWFTKEVIPALAPGGKIIMISTPVTSDCLIERVSNYPHVFFKRYGAENKKGELLWPEHKDRKALAELKAKLAAIGQLYVYYTEYLCNPLPPDKHPFKEDMFEYFKITDVDTKKLNIFIIIDLAIGEKKRNAYSALLVIGVDQNDIWYVLAEYQVKTDSYNFAKDCYGYRNTWDPLDVGVEEAALQKIFWSVLRLTAEKHGWKQIYPIGILADVDKDIATRRLIPRFRIKKIKFLRDQIKTKDQLILFPDTRFRDLIDCLAMGERFCYPKGASAPKKEKRESWRDMKAATDEEMLQEQLDDEERKLSIADSWDFEMEE